jgi:SAM-dependent methyltransferase
MSLVLDGLRTRLLSSTDTAERVILAARLLDHPATVVDVGGGTGDLAAHLAGAAVTAVNIDASADVVIEPGPHPLPFEDRTFEASASLDTLEHIPVPDRQLFVRETLRVARSRTVLCCPLGSPARSQVERADNDWFRELTGEEHPWISEHLEHGPPTLEELGELFSSSDHDVRFHFNGNLRTTSRQFRMSETSYRTRRPVAMARWAAFRLVRKPDLTLTERPSPTTNRVFVVAERRAA